MPSAPGAGAAGARCGACASAANVDTRAAIASFRRCRHGDINVGTRRGAPPRPTLTPGSRRSPATQDGLVTRAELLALPLTPRARSAGASAPGGSTSSSAASTRSATPPSRPAPACAPALLASGRDAALSHDRRVALAARPDAAGDVHVLVAGTAAAVAPGDPASTRRGARSRCRAIDGLRFTSPLRTLEDLAPRHARDSPACAARRSYASSSPRTSSTRPGSTDPELPPTAGRLRPPLPARLRRAGLAAARRRAPDRPLQRPTSPGPPRR